MHLTATKVKNSQPKEKPYKLSDGGGRYLLVNPNGTRYWRYKYRFAGKEKVLALGVYPEVSLKQAHQQHQTARETLAHGADPGEERKLQKLTRHLAAAESFKAVANEWFDLTMAEKSRSYHDRTKRILDKDLYPVVGNRPIKAITAPELLAALR